MIETLVEEQKIAELENSSVEDLLRDVEPPRKSSHAATDKKRIEERVLDYVARLALWVVIGYAIMTGLSFQPEVPQEDMPQVDPQAYQIRYDDSANVVSGTAVLSNF